MIKLDNHLLFVEREDNTREGIPHFVLPGGRLNIHDLRKNLDGLDQSEYMKILQSPSNNEAIDSLPHTLKRELEEELGLISSEYSVGEEFKLDPYNKLEGARANHGYTRYELSLFKISLNCIIMYYCVLLRIIVYYWNLFIIAGGLRVGRHICLSLSG